MTTLVHSVGVNRRAKLAQLILACIKYGADADGKIPKTKLAKLIYLSDFNYFYDNLEPISGVVYKKLGQGPVPLEYFDELTDLTASKKINLTKRGRATLVSLKDAEEGDGLNKDEMLIVKQVCGKWKGKKTADIVDFTHNQIPWKISFIGDEIPYSLIVQQDEATLY